MINTVTDWYDTKQAECSICEAKDAFTYNTILKNKRDRQNDLALKDKMLDGDFLGEALRK